MGGGELWASDFHLAPMVPLQGSSFLQVGDRRGGIAERGDHAVWQPPGVWQRLPWTLRSGVFVRQKEGFPQSSGLEAARHFSFGQTTFLASGL